MIYPPLNVLSLMSGTSCDGIDAVLARLELTAAGLRWAVVARASRDYPPPLRERLLKALNPASSHVALLTQLHAEVGQSYAALAGELCDSYPVDLVALSGQTVYHIPRLAPERGWFVKSTLQLGEAAYTVERCGLPVMCDFRQSDLAAGGEGAPLVAFGDLALYHRPGVARAVQNLGGIANLTYLPASGDPAGVLAFDTGPANCLIDEAAARYFGLPYDVGGKLAAQGRAAAALLEALLRHPYLKLPPPKTTGREVFSLDALEPQVSFTGLRGEDVLATLTAFTAASIAEAYQAHLLPLGLDEVLVAGGGALNPTLLRELRARLPVPVTTFEERGWVSKDREALAFAVMAYYAAYGLANTLPQATGAKHPVVAGKRLVPWQPRNSA
jgi:anhydro-N-acetylmuramic acid kinase